MGVKLVLQGHLVETVSAGEVLAATVDEGAAVGNGLHVRLTSVDKRREHHALGRLVGRRVRITVELVSEEVDEESPAVGQVASQEMHWAKLVGRVSDRQRQSTSAAGVAFTDLLA